LGEDLEQCPVETAGAGDAAEKLQDDRSRHKIRLLSLMPMTANKQSLIGSYDV
jgi:hypothetical protein